MNETETERSLLRVRPREHWHPDRKGGGELQVEVWRDGEVVATIYGSREGIHIISERFTIDPVVVNQPFFVNVESRPGVVVPLLKDGETCPWCLGTGSAYGADMCPVCRKTKTGVA